MQVLCLNSHSSSIIVSTVRANSSSSTLYVTRATLEPQPPQNDSSETLHSQLLQSADAGSEDSQEPVIAEQAVPEDSDTQEQVDSLGRRANRAFFKKNAELKNGNYVCNKCGEELKCKGRDLRKHFHRSKSCNLAPWFMQK